MKLGVLVALFGASAAVNLEGPNPSDYLDQVEKKIDDIRVKAVAERQAMTQKVNGQIQK